MRSTLRIATSVAALGLLAPIGSGCSSDSSGTTVLETFATLPLPTGVDATAAPTTTDAAMAPGVAGLDDPDAFCAAWAAYSGSLQVLGIAQSFGGMTPAQIAVLEMYAGPVVAGAVDTIDSTWPTELASEHDAVVSEFLGPFARRAVKAEAQLTEAGVTPAELDQIAAAWRTVLSTRDPLDPVVEPPALDAALVARVNAAASAFDAAVTPFAQDPSLRVGDVSIPATNQYLSQHCPALATNGVGDSV